MGRELKNEPRVEGISFFERSFSGTPLRLEQK